MDCCGHFITGKKWVQAGKDQGLFFLFRDKVCNEDDFSFSRLDVPVSGCERFAGLMVACGKRDLFCQCEKRSSKNQYP